MDTNNLLKNIERFMVRNNQEYFSYAWREKINQFLTNESRFIKLVHWINEKIETYKINMNVFNPADKIENYTNEYFNNYVDACKNIAILLNFKCIILDNNCTMRMRNNIEYALCKLYKIKYNKKLDCYL